jgi:hypothetical protein
MDYTTLSHWLPLFIILAAWELIWKGLALWRAGRRQEPIWFAALLVINTAGILPIIYLLMTNPKKPQRS